VGQEILTERNKTVAVFLLAFAAYWLTRCPPSPHNEAVLQAWAFLHGHAWVEQPVWEHVQFGGHNYLLHPPGAAILLLPFVAIWGLGTNQTAVSVLLCAIEAALAWRLLGVFGLKDSARLWLTAFFSFGTVLFYEGTLGYSWGFVSISSVLPTLLALSEVFGKRRPLLVGLWAGLAALCRYDLVLVWPIYATILLCA
jgi:hypothetical protein